jgi:hypothetical protein
MRKLLTLCIALAVIAFAPLNAKAAGWLLLVKAGGGSTLSFSWQSSAVSGSTPAPSSTLFTTQAIGTASSDRIVVVGISWKGTASAGMDIPSNGVIIGGVTATQGAYLRGTNSRATALYYANVPTGTTATIGITGYSNGFIDEIIINTGIITGSGTTSNPSNITSVLQDIRAAQPDRPSRCQLMALASFAPFPTTTVLRRRRALAMPRWTRISMTPTHSETRGRWRI